MFEIIIRESSRTRSYSQHHNVRAKAREKTNLTPLNSATYKNVVLTNPTVHSYLNKVLKHKVETIKVGGIRDTIGQTESMPTIQLSTSIPSGSKIGFGNGNGRNFTHEYKGYYQFNKPSKHIFRLLNRDLMALRKAKCTNSLITIKVNNETLFSQQVNFCLADTLKTVQRIKNAVMSQYKLQLLNN